MKRFAYAMVCGVLASTVHVYASGADTERVLWNVGETGSAVMFSEILVRAAEAIPQINVQGLSRTDILRAAKCDADFVRPGNKLGPFLDQYNFLRCSATTNDGKTGVIQFDMSDIPVHRYGNSMAPRGVAIKQDVALALFTAMETYYAELGPDGYFNRNVTHLESKTTAYDFLDYYITTKPFDTIGTKSLICSKEWIYGLTETKTKEPQYVRCEFVYMYEMNEEQKAEVNRLYGPAQ